eukprot:CAMPEP_0113231656 /NCGR_PEP_ID=MMETSP0008_2-20120614/1539_1 /TAXON_ID=97485 /ORGANISM="Prymnesium parvum" /LENGTH=146 /DNA_ID=CAMNT_0000078331 /DNA_START=520 /DNA_END=960 /DNA_ORIENTATION=+ /assembly_acc=CAM_ASM_000153
MPFDVREGANCRGLQAFSVPTRQRIKRGVARTPPCGILRGQLPPATAVREAGRDHRHRVPHEPLLHVPKDERLLLPPCLLDERREQPLQRGDEVQRVVIREDHEVKERGGGRSPRVQRGDRRAHRPAEEGVADEPLLQPVVGVAGA